jgi:teichuronic acid exporter
VGGTLVSRLVTGVLVFRVSRWRPSFHFRWDEVRGFLRLGLNVAAARSLFFVFQKVDVFVIAKLLGTQSVGYYSIALQLANMPTDKIAAVVNQVAFPLFAKLQHDQAQLRNLYVRITRGMAIVAAPLYLAGAVWGGDIISIALADKWAPAAFLFRALCLAQLATALTILNTPLHTAVGRAHWPTYFYAACVPAMALSIFVSAHYGLNAVVLPWLTVYPVLVIVWTLATLRSIDVNVAEVGAAVGVQICFSALAVMAARWLAVQLLGTDADVSLLVAVEFSIGAILYVTYLFLAERRVLMDFWGLRQA